MLSPHRRHKKANDATQSSADAVRMAARKESSRPGTSTGISSTTTASGTTRGIFSSLIRSRRWWGKSHRESDTLLPTTYSSSTGNAAAASSPRRPNISPTAKDCNSFLMGGNYYPGKDKKRRHLRRRTLWYRLFCSSNWRRLVTVFVLAYILVWHVVVPFGTWLLQLGVSISTRRSQNSANWLLYDTALTIPALNLEKKIALEIAAHRARLPIDAPERMEQRKTILENIVPVWFHRNDLVEHVASKTNTQNKGSRDKTGHKAETNKEVQQHDNLNEANNQGIPTKNDKETSEMDEPLDAHNSQKEHAESPNQQTNADAKQESTENSRILFTNGERLPTRTIHFSNANATSYSSCRSHDTSTTSISTTLVTQSSLSRLWILKETCSRWKGPIVVVVFIPMQEAKSATQETMLQYTCPNVKLIVYQGNEEESQSANYPVNRLRNVGLDAVTTTHVLVIDMDFVPSMELDRTIHDALELHQVYKEGLVDDGSVDTSKQALIVPAFERLPPGGHCESDQACASYLQKNSSFLPMSFENLQDCVLQRDCIVFQSNVNWEGHYSTMSERWLQQKWYQDENTDKKAVYTVPCFRTARYEPYVVLEWCPSESKTPSSIPLAPYYDERFHGYGKNKIELISHLRKSGYRFGILPEGFIVHNPHPESQVKQNWNERRGGEGGKEADLHTSMDKLYSKFLQELDEMYKEIHHDTIKLCEHE